MTNNTISAVPDFTVDESMDLSATRAEEVKQAVEETLETPAEEEKETPAEPPAVETPALTSDDPVLQKQVAGLQEERQKLLQEIQTLRGTRREIKQEQLTVVQNKLDDLSDLHPNDVSVIERVLQAKGYVRSEDVEKKIYERVQQDELSSFLNKYPQYKPENDTDNHRWNALQHELGYYRMPSDPSKIGEVLERAHKMIAPVPQTADRAVQQRRVAVAGVGAGSSTQRSSSTKTLDPRRRSILEAGGFTEEDIKRIESNLE